MVIKTRSLTTISVRHTLDSSFGMKRADNSRTPMLLVRNGRIIPNATAGTAALKTHPWGLDQIHSTIWDRSRLPFGKHAFFNTVLLPKNHHQKHPGLVWLFTFKLQAKRNLADALFQLCRYVACRLRSDGAQSG